MAKNGKSGKAQPTKVADTSTPGVAIYSHTVGGKNAKVAGRTFNFPRAEGPFADGQTGAQALATFFDSDEGRAYLVGTQEQVASMSGAAYVDRLSNVQARTYCRNRAAGIGRGGATGERAALRSLKKAGTADEKKAAGKALLASLGIQIDDLI